jgi:hypothetical protein
MLASAMTPASGIPCCCIDHATPKEPTEPALVPSRKVLVVGYRLWVNWIAALVARSPFVVRAFPSSVTFGLCGSAVFAPL